MNFDWSRDSWQKYGRLQNPAWPNDEILNTVKKELSLLPGLVFAGETRELQAKIAEASHGKSFILQVGDCAEQFSNCHGPYVHKLMKLTLQMSLILSLLPFEKIVKIGRIAGQYGKPRSNDFEEIDGLRLPVFRGELVNSPEVDLDKRMPDPKRLLEGYFRSASTLNLIRAFHMGGYGKSTMINDWLTEIDCDKTLTQKTLDLIENHGEKLDESSELNSYYTSHEALIMDYEEPLVRLDTTTGRMYSTSAHFLWLGERTRQLSSPQVEFLRGIDNPIGIKVGPSTKPDELSQILDKLNPSNVEGRISLITRLGSKKVSSILPSIVTKIEERGHFVTWISDPMHGNTVVASNGLKTRRTKDIKEELLLVQSILSSLGVCLGGVHLEVTGDSVRECTDELELEYESSMYKTLVDPRLNPKQAVDVMLSLVEKFKK